MHLKKTLNFRGKPKTESIEYFDGEYKEIQTDKFESLWELLNIFSLGVESIGEKKIKDWQKKYSFTADETLEIVGFLKSEGLLDTEKRDTSNEDKFYYRNNNYFSIFSNGKTSFLSELKKLTILIMGTGTVGSTLAITLSKLGVGNLIIMDDDLVEDKNIPAQVAFEIADDGKSKVEVLKEKILKTNPNTKVKAYQLRIDEENLSLIENLILENNIRMAVSCFDQGSLDIHLKLYELFSENQIDYLLSGYTNNTIGAILLEELTGKETLVDNFKDFNPRYSIGENHGTILHSYISSLLISYLLLHKLGLFGEKTFRKQIQFNFSTFSATTIENEKLIDKELFIKFLGNIIELNRIEEKLNLIELSISNNSKINFMENDLLEIYQILEIIDYIGEDQLISIEEKERFYKLFNSLDDSELPQNNLLVDDKYTEEQYRQLINTININGERPFKLLARINNENDYSIQKNLQKKVYDILKPHSAYFINCFVENKKSFLNIDYENTTMLEINGISSKNIEDYESVFVDNHKSLSLMIYKLLFKDDDVTRGKYDYLYYIEKENQLTLSFEQGMDLYKNILENNQLKSRFGFNNLIHVNKLLNSNLIMNVPNTELYKTYFFPEAKESRILIDYDESMLSFQNLIHEIGHSYFNQKYDLNFFDKSQQVINESLAILSEIIFHISLLKDPSINKSIKKAFLYHYIIRLNKLTVASFATFELEHNLIKHIQKTGNLNLEKHLEIREETKRKLLPNVEFENEENSYLNIFLNSPFLFDYKELAVESISTMLALHMFEEYKENLDVLELKIDKFIKSDKKGIDFYTQELFGQYFDTSLIEKMVCNIKLHLEEIERIQTTINQDQNTDISI